MRVYIILGLFIYISLIYCSSKVISNKPIHHDYQHNTAVHGNRILYNIKLFQNSINNSYLLILPPLNRLDSLIQHNNKYSILNSSLRYNNEPTYTPLSIESLSFIKMYNGSLNMANKQTLFLNFLSYINKYYPNVKLGIYISSCTCVFNPQSISNIYGAGNTYPPSVLNCNDISNFPAITPSYFPGTKGISDGRYHVDYNDTIQQYEFINEITNIVTQFKIDYIFLDNARYFNANWKESTICENLFYKCYTNCSNMDCLSKCESEIDCMDSRLQNSIIIDTTFAYITHFNNYINYFHKLVNTINKSNIKCILNISVLPYILNNKIENNYWSLYKTFLQNNAVSFEQAWKGRHSPQFVLNELNVYHDLIENNTEIYLYPQYSNNLEGFWFATMSYIISTDKIKLFRSPYENMSSWANLPSNFGPGISDYIFTTNCTECLTKRGGYEGDFILSKKFKRES